MQVPKSDTIVVTSHPAAWDELAAITCETHKAYCDRHGFDYDVDRSDLVDSRQGGANVSIRGFTKFNRILHFMNAMGPDDLRPKYKNVIWLDADLVVTNTERDLTALWWWPGEPPLKRKELLCGYDWNGWNTTVIVARSTPRTQALFWAANNTGRDLFLYHGWHEMQALRYFTERPPYDQLWRCESIKTLAAILPEEYEGAGVPRPIMAPYAWEPGDFAVHLSALSLPRRIELARKYAEVALEHH